MNAPAVAADHATDTDGWRHFNVAALLLTLGLVGLGLIFRTEVVAAIATWEASTAYNHCFLIIPITLYMIWDRRETLRGLRARPMPVAALLGVAPAVGWLLAERLGIMEGRQLMAVAFAEILFLAVLGWRLWRAVSGPLLYLFFLVPFGEFLVPRLQDITALFIQFGLGLTNIPAYIDGYTIEIPEGTFYVAEACAGLRFLVASIAFGVLYALMMYRTLPRRIIFILVSIIIPIIANGFRALGIVVLGHVLGSAEAAAADHILYGWIFFSIVILLLTVLGLPFRQDLAQERRTEPDPDQGMFVLAPGVSAVITAVAIAAVSPGIALALERVGAANIATPIAVRPPPGCEVLSQSPVATPAGAGRLLSTRLRCRDVQVDMAVELFSARTTSGPIMVERRRLTRPRSSEDASEFPIPATETQGTDTQGAAWRLIRTTEPHSLAVAGVWIDGVPSTVGLGMRIRQAMASVLGSDHAPALVVIRPHADLEHLTPERRREIERALLDFVRGLPDVDATIRAQTRLP